MYEDNTACIEWGNIGGLEHAKHIDIQKHFEHEVIQNAHMKLILVATANQLADFLTKQLHFKFPQWQACHRDLGQEDSYYHLRDFCPPKGVLSPRLSS
jgi:hypothetical protein